MISLRNSNKYSSIVCICLSKKKSDSVNKIQIASVSLQKAKNKKINRSIKFNRHIVNQKKIHCIHCLICMRYTPIEMFNSLLKCELSKCDSSSSAV